MLDSKKRERKAKKKTRMQIPPGGMGSGLERAYSKDFILLLLVTITAN